MSFLSGIKGRFTNPSIKETIITRNQMSLLDSSNREKMCKIMISCAIGQKIRELLLKHFKTANEAFTSQLTCEDIVQNVNDSSTDISKLYGLTDKIKEFTIKVSRAETQRKNLISKEIITTGSGLKCVALLTDAVDQTGNPQHRFEGTIVKIDPKNKKFYVTIKTWKKDKNGVKPIDLTKEIDLTLLCIGGDKAGEDADECKLKE